MFSVVIPLYNKRKFIGSTLDSVLGQDCDEFEVIVVDDGSSDGGGDVVATRSDRRIRIMRQKNQGVGVARNEGVRASNGQWIAFLDADDLWAPYHLRVLKKIIEQKPEAGFISTKWEMVKENEQWSNIDVPSIDEVEIKSVDFFECSMNGSRFFHTSSIAVRRDVFDLANGFGHFQPGQDVDLWVRLAFISPCAVGNVTTDGRRTDAKGITSKAKVRVPTREIGPCHLPTPVLSRLDEFLRSGVKLSNRAAVERYFDHRLLIGIRAALIRGDRLRVWKLWRLLQSPFGIMALLHLLAVGAPQMLVRFVFSNLKGP